MPYIIAVLFLFSAQFGIDYYTPKWWTLTSLSAIPVFFLVRKHLGTMIAVIFAYLVVQSAYFGFGYFNNPPLKNIHKVSVLLGTVFTFASVLILPYLAHKKARQGLCIAFGINVIWTILTGLGLLNGYYGFDYNLSVTATILSLSMPIVMHNLKLTKHGEFYLMVATFMAIILTNASAGLIGFFASLFIYGWFKWGKMISIISTASSITVGWFAYGKELLNGNGRLWAWDMYLQQSGDLFGKGFGISPSYMQLFQTTKKYHWTSKEVFWWAHNDLLQMYFECGAIFAALIVITYLMYLIKCFGDKACYATMFLVAYGVNSLVNFPHHHATGIITILFGLLMVRKDLTTRRDRENTSFIFNGIKL